MRRPWAHRSPRGLTTNFLAGAAAGTFVMPRLHNSPTPESAKKIKPDHAWWWNLSDITPAEKTARIRARNVPNSSRPLAHERRDLGSSSGRSPYFDGPNSAAWVLARKMAA